MSQDATFQFDGELTAADFADALRVPHRIFTAFGAIVMAVALFGLGFGLWHRLPAVRFIPMFVFACFALYVMSIPRRTVRHVAAQHAGKAFRASVGATEVATQWGAEAGATRWESVRKARVDERGALLFTAGGRFVLLPRRLLRSGSWDALAALVAERVPAR